MGVSMDMTQDYTKFMELASRENRRETYQYEIFNKMTDGEIEEWYSLAEREIDEAENEGGIRDPGDPHDEGDEDTPTRSEMLASLEADANFVYESAKSASKRRGMMQRWGGDT